MPQQSSGRLIEAFRSRVSAISIKAEISKLLKEGVSIDETDQDGKTALFRAFYFPKLVKYLVDEGITVNHLNHAGDTALLHAIENAAAVALLLKAGAKRDAKGPKGKTALEVATALDDSPAKKKIVALLGKA